MNPGVLRWLVRIDVRRPATWIAAAMGAAAGGCVSMAGGEGWSLALVLLMPALAVAAAVGDVPLGLCAGTPPPTAGRMVALWAAERAAWPLAGGLLVAAFRMTPAGGWAAPLGAIVAAFTATIVIVGGRLSGATAAEAAGLALALVGGGAAAAFSVRTAGFGRSEATAAAIVAWCLAAALAWAWRRSAAAWSEQASSAIDVEQPATWHARLSSAALGADDDAWEVLHLDRLPASGPITNLLEKFAMATGLAAMAGWMTLPDDPGGMISAVFWAWALLSAVWFVCLAVPRATLMDGCCGSASWERLFRCGPASGTGDRHRLRSLTGTRPGMPRFAAGVALVPAAILGWPALVGGLLSLPQMVEARPPLAIALGLAVAAIVLTSLTGIGAYAGATRETLLALALACCTAVAAAVLLGCPMIAAPAAPPAPGPPKPPSLVRGPDAAPHGPRFAGSAPTGRGDALSGSRISC